MRLTDLVLTNVEALAQEESVKIPCEYKEGETCTFKVITPSGLEGEATAIDAIKVK